MGKDPKDHVKKHLKKNGVNPAMLPPAVIEALNAFSEEELVKVDCLGEALEAANLPDIKISAVH
jgi:hypothetical protein